MTGQFLEGAVLQHNLQHCLGDKDANKQPCNGQNHVLMENFEQQISDSSGEIPFCKIWTQITRSAPESYICIQFSSKLYAFKLPVDQLWRTNSQHFNLLQPTSKSACRAPTPNFSSTLHIKATHKIAIHEWQHVTWHDATYSTVEWSPAVTNNLSEKK